ncbi:MAG TPA: NYN domain-containing protein [Gemmatimonadales bacterium]|nr:NYN domain-containing protein [Gemmatimonadales bacterium]
MHKEPPAHAPNAALMIDFDNVTMAIRSDLQTELKRLLQSEIIRGKVAVQRAYADWRRYPQYIVPLSESSIDLIFAPAHGANKKNATDIRLAIDALELVFTRPEIGTFILLSGDSDFSSLVLKLKEYGKYVIGVGIRESSSDLLIQNCDEYYSYNELAGFTKASDVEYVKRDPWELVVEAVKQMTAHNDVMRSDRLKQVMQEIDPNFDEKDAGFSRFSKFVIEAARRGLITLTRLDNGQYEIALGPQVEGAPAQPALAALSEATERADRPARSRGGRGRGRGRGGRDREEQPAPQPEQAESHVESEEPAAKAGFSFGDAFGRLKQAITGSDSETAAAEAQEPETAQPVSSESTEAAAPKRDLEEEEDDIPMPASSAPPPPYSTPSSSTGVPMRSARFRRGSRGGAPRGGPGGAPDIPRIGVVEVDPNFRPRGDVTPPRQPSGQPGSSVPSSTQERGERSERGERGGRGGRGRGGRDRNRGENGDRGGERGRGRRGGRGGRGRGPRRYESEGAEATNSARPMIEPAPAPVEQSPPPPPPAPSPAKAVDADPGESFWSKVKRGLTGGGA